VKRFRLDPARVGREAADTFDKASKSVADGVGDVECDEEAHGLAYGCRLPDLAPWLLAFDLLKSEVQKPKAESRKPEAKILLSPHINFFLSISKAIVEAKRRMRLRSPGKLR
jgi:hypothetical protein